MAKKNMTYKIIYEIIDNNSWDCKGEDTITALSVNEAIDKFYAKPAHDPKILSKNLERHEVVGVMRQDINL